MKYKGKTIHPYESFYWDTTQDFFRGELGGGIARCVKCDDSLATLVMDEAKVQQVMNIVDDTNIGFKNPQRGRVYSVDELSPCICCYEGGGLEPKVINPLKGQTDNGWHYEQQVYADDGITRAMKAGEGSGNIPKVIVEDNEQWNTIIGNKQLNPFRGSVDGTSPCITSACGMGGGMTPMLTDADLETTKQKEFIEQIRGHKEMEYRIRKLTPKECFRLMGVDDEDIDKIQASGISNSSQYKLAGNSIVVDVLYHIFRKAFVEKDNESQQLTFF